MRWSGRHVFARVNGVLRVALGGFLLIAMIGVPRTSASGDDHTIPRVTIHVGGKQRVGSPNGEHWSFRNADGTCGYLERDGVPHFEKDPLEYSPSKRVRIRLGKKQQPLAVTTIMWRDINRLGYPRGRVTHPGFVIRPLFESGTVVAWKVVLQARTRGHSFLGIRVAWPDEDGCTQAQEVDWYFHLLGRDRG